MPHLILSDCSRLADAETAFLPTAHRWRRAVIKHESAWLRSDHNALLVEGVVVEFSRALHPVALIAPHHDNVIVRLWDCSPVERTEAVQRWLAMVAGAVLGVCGGRLTSTNIAEELLQDLDLPR